MFKSLLAILFGYLLFFLLYTLATAAVSAVWADELAFTLSAMLAAGAGLASGWVTAAIGNVHRFRNTLWLAFAIALTFGLTLYWQSSRAEILPGGLAALAIVGVGYWRQRFGE